MLGKAECPWSPALSRDAARIGSVAPQAASIRVPWLLVHGDADELVPYQDALDARAAAGGRPALVTLAGADHRFTGAIPRMVEATVPWLRARMSRRELSA
jgi:putative redox protein